MATAAQTLANRENAQHSTGPRTDEGKAKSSLNNLQHGLAARGFVVLPGQEPNFASLEDGLREDLLPKGALQETVFLSILEASWNLHRCRLAQGQLYSTTNDPAIDPLINDQLEAKVNRLQKYARQFENSKRKNLEDLRRLQTEAQFRHEAYPLSENYTDDEFNNSPHGASVVCDIAKITQTLVKTRPIHRANDNSNDDHALDMLKEMCRPPAVPRNFQFEPELLDDAA